MLHKVATVRQTTVTRTQESIGIEDGKNKTGRQLQRPE